MSRNYAALPHDYLQEMRKLDDAEFGRLCRALLLYSATGETPQLSGREEMFLDRVIMQEDRFQVNYEELAAMRRENGRKGGRPRKLTGRNETPEKPDGFSETQKKPDGFSENHMVFSETKKTYTETETKTETETETDLLPSTEGGSIEAQSASPAPARGKRGRKKKPAGPQKPTEPNVQWAEFVTMTNAEHEKLLAAYGPADTARLIEILDCYKGSCGKTYVSDYRAILSWCVQALEEEKAKAQRLQQQAASRPFRSSSPKMQAGQTSSQETIARQNEQMLRLREQLAAEPET